MQKIDARGRICPMPLYYTKRKTEEMKAGEELKVIVDAPTAKETIPRWSGEHGHEVLNLEEKGNCFRVVVTKRS